MLYIASSLFNKARVRELRDMFLAQYNVELTFDWTALPWVDNPDMKPDKAQIQEAARGEYGGVVDARCILAVLPGRNGTHFELGAAYHAGTPIVILNEDPNYAPVSFHNIGEGIEVFEDESAAVARVLEILGITNA